ncbi:MAG: hypothetical protein CMJ81_10840 [Planctomycetaceae bacterium]|nr:hypothetical protein [Planctomycetaceae bacterium]
MHHHTVIELNDCTEFRQTLEARPPRIVHGTMILLSVFMVALIVWSALTKPNLVVRASGRVRPMMRENPSSSDVSEETKVVPATGGQVIEVHFQEGGQVREGKVLIRLDTRQLQNKIAMWSRTMQTGNEELNKLDSLELLLRRQYEAAKAKAEAEVNQVKEELHRATQRQRSEIHLVELELELAKDLKSRVQQMIERNAVTERELVEAMSRVREAEEKLAQARVPLDKGRTEVFRQALQLVDEDYNLKREELELKRVTKQGEVDAAEKELANLEFERQKSVLRVPTNGVLTSLDVKVGDIVQLGHSVASIAEQAGYRIDVNVSNEDVGLLQVGMPACIKLDAYDYQKYGTLGGTVLFVSPDSKVSQNSNGQQSATYTVKIALEGEEVSRGELHGRVKLGMTGLVEIVTGQESLLTLLVKGIHSSISLG